jgi:hypothetical protein
MAMDWGCGTMSKAGKRYVWRMLMVSCGYVLAVWGTTSFVVHRHPQGGEVYALALLPTIPVLCMLGVVGLYLREEQDEFQRMLVVRSILLAIAGTLSLSVFGDFLRSYGARKTIPPFTEFVVFWVLFGLVQGVQQTLSRTSRDE